MRRRRVSIFDSFRPRRKRNKRRTRLQRARVFLGRSRGRCWDVWDGFGFGVGCRAIQSKLIDRQPSPPPPHRAKAQLPRSTGGVRRPQQQQQRSVCVCRRIIIKLTDHRLRLRQRATTHNVNQVDLTPEPNKTTTTTQLWTRRHEAAAAAPAVEAGPLRPSRRRPTESTWICGGRQGKATWSGAAGSSRSRAWT